MKQSLGERWETVFVSQYNSFNYTFGSPAQWTINPCMTYAEGFAYTYANVSCPEAVLH